MDDLVKVIKCFLYQNCIEDYIGFYNALHEDLEESGDGKSMFDADNLDFDGNNFNHSKSGIFSTYGWVPSFNLRCTGEEDFTPPLKRTERPTASNFIQIARLFKPEPSKPNKPVICKTMRDGVGGEINKPNAENYCNGQPNAKDPRGNKNLLILKKNGRHNEQADIYNSAGKKVGCFKRYGSYKTGLWRWYQGNCSGLTPTQLMNELGDEWGFVRFKDASCIRFNAIRRQWDYR